MVVAAAAAARDLQRQVQREACVWRKAAEMARPAKKIETQD